MFNCHKDNCDGELILDGSDSRQEWCRQFYVCGKCRATYAHLTTYKPQSHLVESDELIDEETNEVVE